MGLDWECPPGSNTQGVAGQVTRSIQVLTLTLPAFLQASGVHGFFLGEVPMGGVLF